MNLLPPVVLVHGLWHGSWCWSPVTERLASLGIPSVAVDLDGHGLKARSPQARLRRPFDPAAYATEPSPVAGVTASSAAETLIAQLRRIGNGRPCVLVAHSMGGVVATAAAEQAPDLISEIVYLSAFAPVNGNPAAHYITEPENAGEMVTGLLVADPTQVGALRQDTDDHNRLLLLQEVFYGDVDDDIATAAISLLSPDGPAGIAGQPVPVTPQRYGAIPHTYMVCLQDKVVPVALQRRFIDEIDAVSAHPTTVVELDTSHSPFLSRPGELADKIASVYRAQRSQEHQAESVRS
ncbi:alpha/beta hydrolase [Streptomyces sp. NPDC048663]|uniref:alpha/beta fold hydrolase n=1 Tax=Streptomyces sp. NPDC048663 TaxID=3155638 RepID=UPI003412E6AF